MNIINKENFYELIGSAINIKRKELGYTQIELANKTGMSRTSIVNIEKGRQFPPLHLLWEISQALDCNPSDFFPKSSKSFYETSSSSSMIKVINRKSRQGDIKKESASKIKSFINEF
ncbi:helix-turn-helix domain-containing protein [Aestuariibaculum sp. M13]|uniref:helix-turn-helix domain-containing protein n=1 Tax=Aestuariibaculum sp. M13 TaxID=2967132 RepID=UPI002159D810|nr:helix-turn-helix transcriptional regulator [Aestuariibaculum sp. M13]MCR8667296.1 helix-turn-helix domain-containing protein [Aestuariibaculum sp. M13]